MLPREWMGGRVAVALVAAGADRRATARQHVAALLGRPPRDIRLGREPTGKPVLDSPAGASCSFACRNGALMIAAADGGVLGVDLEVVRSDLDACGIAGTLFSHNEAKWLARLEPCRRSAAFTAIWCVKEAVLKATGQGIVAGMSWPVVDGAGVLPFSDGLQRTATMSVGGMCVELRRLYLGVIEAFSCVAFAI